MPEPKQRIIVDGIEFSEIFHFPQILRAVTSALQPPRLVIGLVMVTALMTAGRLYDGIQSPRIAPGGLLAGACTEQQREQAQQAIQRAMLKFGTGEISLDSPVAEPVSARDAFNDLQLAHYRRQEGGGDDDAAAVDETAALQALAEVDRLRPRGTFEATVRHVSDGFNKVIRGLLALRSVEVFDGVADLFVRLPMALWRYDRWFCFIYGAIFLVVASLGGGALCRMAACLRARQERLSIRQSLDFSLANWIHLVFAPILPLLMAGLVALLILVLGLFGRLPWVLELLGGVAYAPALLLGGAVTFLLLGYLAGVSMLIPAVACENCDAPDAQQRAYAYVLNRPLHRIGYAFVGIVGLALGFALVSVFALVLLNGTAILFSAWAGERTGLSALGQARLFDLTARGPVVFYPTASERWTANLCGFWQTIVLCLVPAYVFSYYFASSTRLYLLMRQACDGQAPEEIWLPGMTPGTLTPSGQATDTTAA